jgi:hypothetical protein
MSEMQRLDERLREFAAASTTSDADWQDVLSRADTADVSPARTRRKRRMSRRALIGVTAALLLLGAGSAIGAVALTSSDGSPVQFAPTTGTTPSLGTDAASIIATIKSRVPDVLSIRLANDPIPNGSGKGTTDYLIAHVDVAAAADNGPAYARASWESDLVIGALFTAFAQAGLTPPFTDELTLVLPDGSRHLVGGGLGKVVPDQIFDPVTPAIQSGIQQRAAADGFTNVHVDTFQVVNDVVEIYATTSAAPDVAAPSFFKAHGLDDLLGQSRNDFEGVYFQLDDAKGNPILIESTALRAGSGGWWAAPSTGIQGDRLVTH